VLPVVGTEEIGDDTWRVFLPCGSCGAHTEVAGGDQLERQAGKIAAARRELERDCMCSEFHLLREALARGLIDARDFDCRRAQTEITHRAAL
jgi:hypothetical protein